MIPDWVLTASSWPSSVHEILSRCPKAKFHEWVLGLHTDVALTYKLKQCLSGTFKMTGPTGNREFCFPETYNVPHGKVMFVESSSQFPQGVSEFWPMTHDTLFFNKKRSENILNFDLRGITMFFCHIHHKEPIYNKDHAGYQLILSLDTKNYLYSTSRIF